MEITRSEFSARQDEAEERDEESISLTEPGQEAGQAEKDPHRQSSKIVSEKTEEGPVTTGKETPERNDAPAKEAETGRAASGTLPREKTADLTGPATPSGEKKSESFAHTLPTPRKNVIPPRPTSFENPRKTPAGTLKNSRPLENTNKTDADAQARKTENVGAERQRETHDAADEPTLVLPAVKALKRQTSAEPGSQEQLADQPTRELPAQEARSAPSASSANRDERQQRIGESGQRTAVLEKPTTPLPQISPPVEQTRLTELPTTPLPSMLPLKPPGGQRGWLTRGRAIVLALLLIILIINATVTGFGQFFGPHGWGSVFSVPSSSGSNLLNRLEQQLGKQTPTPGATGRPTTTPLTPAQIVNTLLTNMTLDEKLGQLLMVQFTGSQYSPQLSAMISQYKIGSVLIFAANGNIVNKTQLTGLISQMQQNAFLPLAIAIDQEGGTVDRLINLDGPQPSAASIGATGNPQVAYQQGMKDAQDLSSYGINLNLAPVVDVTNVYNPQMYERTYGNNPTIVTQMASAYLQGLQKGGKVVGTLKHFPGLGDVAVDPHYRPPDLTRSLNDLNAIDWAPYSNLIKQGNVYAIMVTHEYVKALDSSEPSSLSPQVIGVLRNQMHFQGVIMTDSLTMDSIHNYYSYGQAAAKAIEAGDDILMGAASPNDVAAMIDGIKQAMSSGAISQQQIDAAVRRILLLKYQMGLLHIHS